AGGDITQRSKSAVLSATADRWEATMVADLDLLLTVVYCMTDDFLPRRPVNARRAISDAEIVTLCVAQAIMGIPSDYRFVAVADKRLRHLFPTIPTRD